MSGASFNRVLKHIDRACGYSLIFLMLLFFISGYGLVKGFMDPYLAKSLHERWLPVPTFMAFLGHVVINIRFLLIRKGVRETLWLNIYTVALAVSLLGLFLYLYFV